MPSLRDIVAAQTAMAEELPLVHTTRCEIFPHIVTSDQLLAVHPCDVFGEHLLYFFYGRPAYRNKDGNTPTGSHELCPICLVFKPDTISRSIKRISACDSGGVHKGYFESFLYQPDRDEMLLDPQIESARRLVPLMFGNNGQYYLGQALPNPPASFAPGTPPARYHGLLRDSGILRGDDRRSSIEIQKDSPVNIGLNLQYVILPSDLLNDPNNLRTITDHWQAEPIPYYLFPGSAPNDYTITIRDELRRKLQSQGML